MSTSVFIGYGYALNMEQLQGIFTRETYPLLYTDDDMNKYEFIDQVYRHIREHYHAESDCALKNTDSLVVRIVFDEISDVDLFIGYQVDMCESYHGTVIRSLGNLNYNKQKELFRNFIDNHPEFDYDEILDDLHILSSCD